MVGCKFPWLPNCQQLLKSDHGELSCSKNKKAARFFKTQCTYIDWCWRD